MLNCLGSLNLLSEHGINVSIFNDFSEVSIKGEINLTTVNITSTVKPNNIIEIEAIPESNDIVGLRDLYINFDISKSKINMVKDVISSGEEVSGSTFIRDAYTSSYSNGTLIRE